MEENKEEQKKIIYETFANNYEVVVLGDEVYIYDHDEEKYKKTENEIRSCAKKSLQAEEK